MMTNSRFLLLHFIVSSLSLSCNSQQDLPFKSGKLKLKTTVHGYSDTSYTKKILHWFYTFNKWYDGDFVIDEKVTSVSHSENGKFTSGERVDSYVLMDFKTGRAAEYLTFTDTARKLQSFGIFDSVKLAGGYTNEPFPDTTTLSNQVALLSDTTVDGILYKRFTRSYVSKTNGRPPRSVQIYYLRPDLDEKMGQIFFWSDSMTRKLKAPIVWAEDKPSVNSPVIFVETRIHFIADTLSKQEQKVFDTWKANMNN